MSDPRRYLSKIARHTKQSDIRAMTFACKQANGINLAQGIADLPVPDIVQTAAKQAVESGENVYMKPAATIWPGFVLPKTMHCLKQRANGSPARENFGNRNWKYLKNNRFKI